ncbi:DUF6455 family protein [Planktotalea arctica]|uniref:DUF6455 family protein n=1 Tax=Planktotalea arctica TaxID=1481893 RepID=UPI00321B8A7E
MTDRTSLKKHAALLDTMSSTRGIDLQSRALAGDVSIDEITDAVFACTNCASPGACGKWLAAHKGGTSHSPSYCENTDLLARLSV